VRKLIQVQLSLDSTTQMWIVYAGCATVFVFGGHWVRRQPDPRGVQGEAGSVTRLGVLPMKT
jgi:hypothetical protein